MSNDKSVWFKDNMLVVQESVLKELGLVAGQSITETQMSNCIELNARAMVDDLTQRRAAGEDVPDTSGLEADLARIAAKR